MSLRISSAMRLAYLKALLGQRVSLLDTQPPGQIAAIITTTANTLQTGISDKLAAILQSMSLIVSAAVIAFLHSWKLTLVTSSGLLLITLCYVITIPFITRNMKQVEDANIKAAATANEALGSIRMIAAYGAEKKMVDRYARWVAESERRGMSLSKVIGMQQATSKFNCRRILTMYTDNSQQFTSVYLRKSQFHPTSFHSTYTAWGSVLTIGKDLRVGFLVRRENAARPSNTERWGTHHVRIQKQYGPVKLSVSPC